MPQNKKSLVSGVIEEKTGMDFDRFTRSILLAQGGFDTFLRADAEQKSRILEQITGTEIYSEISRRVHERQRDERNNLEVMQAEMKGIAVLEPEQEQETRLELESKRREEAKLVREITEMEKAVGWLNGIDDLKKKIGALSEEDAKLKQELESFKPEREKLDRALRASSLDGKYSALAEVRRQQSNDKAALEEMEKTLPELEKRVREQSESLISLEKLTIKAREEQKAAAPIIKKVRYLDQMLDEKKKDGVKHAESCRKDAEEIESNKQNRNKEQQKRSIEENKLKLVKGYLEKHSRDEWLISGLAGVEEQLNSLYSRINEIAAKEADEEKLKSEVQNAIQKQESCIKQHQDLKEVLENASIRLLQEKNALSGLLGDRLLREYRTEKETLLREKAFLEKIAELEDHRAKLEDGKPCPLCGAEKHPFAEGNVPVPDETEKKIEELSKLINTAEDLEVKIRKLEDAEATAGKNLAESEKNLANADYEKKTAEKSYAEVKDSAAKIRTECAELQQVVSDKLQPLGYAFDLNDPESTVRNLKSKKAQWQAKEKEKISIEKAISDIDSTLKQLDAVIETQGRALSEKELNLEALRKEYSEISEERKKLYGDKDPDDEENRMEKAVCDAEQAEKQARTQFAGLQQELTSTKANIDSLTKRVGERNSELKKLESEFTAAFVSVGFEDEMQLREAMLATQEREEIASEAKRLDDMQIDLKARLRDCETDLVKEIDKKITDETLEELEPQLKDLEGKLKQLRDAIAALNHRLAENEVAKERIKEKQAALEAQKSECVRWEKLHSLIGSADGKKYRNFAQGLTFELMVAHANRQLEKMTDRYLLIRDELQPLELNVIDNYQAGEVRSTRNLSGGESFIVSLTLALGLSKMASRRVRVDSLFLDEGFGTLDEEALETALETLSGLQQDGKLIGIISHVSALKERISTQIDVKPVSGGRSVLAGPGCRRGDGGKRAAECEEAQTSGATV